MPSGQETEWAYSTPTDPHGGVYSMTKSSVMFCWDGNTAHALVG